MNIRILKAELINLKAEQLVEMLFQKMINNFLAVATFGIRILTME